MPEHFEGIVNSVRLSPDHLSGSFEAQTHWHVLTGAPCSGKTTLIDRFSALGFTTVPEEGRKYIESELESGKQLEEIRGDKIHFQYCVEDRQVKTEAGLDPEGVLILDRGLPDCLAFRRIAGMDPNGFLPHCMKNRYASVFLLERLKLEQDNCRIEDDQIAGLIEAWLARDYSDLGYAVVKVPLMPIEDRFEFILGWLSERELV